MKTTHLTTKTFSGPDIKPYINELANLRITVFKEYPYLYEGDLAYEKNYITTYLDSPESTMVLAFDGEKIVGVSTAVPLQYETPEVQKPFLDNNMSVNDIYYCGESVLLPAYRGQGIYPIFFQEREQAARQFGCKISTCCAVSRDANDPRKPTNYVPINIYWEKHGYIMHPELFTYYRWKEIGEDTMSSKKMIFWLKQL